MRAVWWAVTIAAAAVLSCFAVSNRQGISLELWPFPYAVDLPLYLLVLGVLLFGFVVGCATAWLRARPRRRELRRRGRHIQALERELAATQSRLAPAAVSGAESALSVPGVVSPPADRAA